MTYLTCETCGHSAPISDQDYADGRFSLNCRCGDTLWIEERLENTCLKCGAATRDPYCAQCVFVVINGGRLNPIVETSFDRLVRG